MGQTTDTDRILPYRLDTGKCQVPAPRGRILLHRPVVLLLLWIFVIQGLVVSGVVRGAEKPNGSIILSDLKQSAHTVTGYFLQPVHWDQWQWMEAGGVTLGSFALMTVDKPIRRQVQDWRGGSDSPIFEFGRWAGRGQLTIVLATGCYGIGFLGGREHLRITGRLLYEALVTAGTATTILKWVFGRHRPYLNDGPVDFTPPGWNSPHRSFPSGHSTVGWLTAGVLAKRTDSKVLKIACYTAASIVSLSRVYHDRHWTSDVFLGGVIGYTAADFVVRQEAQHEVDPKQAAALGIYPLPSGVALEYRF